MVLEVRDVSKRFRRGRVDVWAVRGVSFAVRQLALVNQQAKVNLAGCDRILDSIERRVDRCKIRFK